jgi:hypothetical protein
VKFVVAILLMAPIGFAISPAKAFCEQDGWEDRYFVEFRENERETWHLMCHKSVLYFTCDHGRVAQPGDKQMPDNIAETNNHFVMLKVGDRFTIRPALRDHPILDDTQGFLVPQETNGSVGIVFSKQQTKARWKISITKEFRNRTELEVFDDNGKSWWLVPDEQLWFSEPNERGKSEQFRRAVLSDTKKVTYEVSHIRQSK